jgi:hypothetical protein
MNLQFRIPDTSISPERNVPRFGLCIERHGEKEDPYAIVWYAKTTKGKRNFRIDHYEDVHGISEDAYIQNLAQYAQLLCARYRREFVAVLREPYRTNLFNIIAEVRCYWDSPSRMKTEISMVPKVRLCTCPIIKYENPSGFKTIAELEAK